MRAALICLDLVNDMVHPDSEFAQVRGYAKFAQENNVLEHVAHVQEQFRQLNQLVIHMPYGFSSDYAELPDHSPLFKEIPMYKAFQIGSWGTQIHESVARKPNEPKITKHRLSPFFRTRLEVALSVRKVSHIYVCGAASNLSVESAVRGAFDRDFDVTVLSDCCIAGDMERHERAMENMRPFARVEKFAQSLPILAREAIEGVAA